MDSSALQDDNLMNPQEETLIPSEFLEKYGKVLPLEVRISGLEYVVENISKTDMVLVKGKGETLCELPVHSTVQFGLIYRSESGTPVGNEIFTTVAEVARLATPPYVLCATSAYQGKDTASSVSENEVLVVLNCEEGAPLTVYSTLTKGQKTLPLNCAGLFSTDPAKTKLPLADILRHVPDCLPAVAHAYAEECLPMATPIVLELTSKSLLNLSAKHSLLTAVNPGTLPTLSLATDIPIHLVVPSNTRRRTKALRKRSEYPSRSECAEDKSILKLQALSRQLAEIKERMESLDKTIQSIPFDRIIQAYEQLSAGSGRPWKKYIDNNEILALLDSENLEQYKEIFRSRHITGRDLPIITEDILTEDLHVTMQLHRTRLMKLFKKLMSHDNR